MVNKNIKKILVADDEEQNRLLLKLILEKEGYNVVEAYNGKEAVNKVIQETPDLIVMDVMMPEMTGIEASKILKQKNKTKNIPIIILSALDERNEDINNIKNLVNDIIFKPIDIKKFISKVKKLC